MIIDTVIATGAASTRTVQCLPDLRFIYRDGQRILQQAWKWQSDDGKTGGIEWKAVPLELNP